ncbi:hypothetical protein [Desulfonatronospira thiodismutans]
MTIAELAGELGITTRAV